MDYKKSIEEVEKVLTELIQENKNVPIIVEGEKDVQALRKLGITGEILTVNTGVNLTDFCDNVAEKYTKVIVLTDWDRKGGFLGNTIKKNLQGRVVCNMFYREVFAKNTMIRTLEGLPSWIKKIKETKIE